MLALVKTMQGSLLIFLKDFGNDEHGIVQVFFHMLLPWYEILYVQILYLNKLPGCASKYTDAVFAVPSFCQTHVFSICSEI